MPSAVEVLIIVGSFSLAILLYILAAKFVPVIAVWEEREGKLYGGPPR